MKHGTAFSQKKYTVDAGRLTLGGQQNKMKNKFKKTCYLDLRSRPLRLLQGNT